jgi:hypothetical protein
MRTLILATDDSAAGCLKATGLADRVWGIDYRLVTGPVPPIAEPLAFFAERARLGFGEIPDCDEDGTGSRMCNHWREVIRLVNDFDRVEIWADPEPNCQLLMIQLLDWLGACDGVRQKLAVANADIRVGNCEPGRIVELGLYAQPLSDTQLRTARAALHAFQHATPEAWAALIGKDLQPLPHLRPTVERMLEELPAADTALTVAETSLLGIIATGPVPPPRVFGTYFRETPDRVLDYWELGDRLHGLAQCQTPAIVGLDDAGPVNLALHDDRERHERFRQSKLSLSEFGRALVKGQADFARHNTIARWWGGTRLTNDRLWRWDAVKRVLVRPA